MLNLLLLLTLAGGVHSQTIEERSAIATEDFKVKLRVLSPSGEKRPLKFGLKHPLPLNAGAFTSAGIGVRGGAMGVELEQPLDAKGVSLVSGIYSYHRIFDPEQAADGRWTRDVMTGGPPVALRKRLVRIGVGDAGGRGVFLEPHVTAGVAPISFVEHFSADRAEDLPDSIDEFHASPRRNIFAPLATYAAAGIDLLFGNKFAVGVDAKRFDQWGFKGYGAPMWGVHLTVLQGAWNGRNGR